MSKGFSFLLFVGMSLSFWIHWVLQRSGIHVPFIHAYMDDLICLPVILFPLLVIYRRWVIRSNTYVLPTSYIITACIVLCVVFEVWLPSQNSSHTSDPLDMLMYAAGGLLFWFMQMPFKMKTNRL